MLECWQPAVYSGIFFSVLGCSARLGSLVLQGLELSISPGRNAAVVATMNHADRKDDNRSTRISLHLLPKACPTYTLQSSYRTHHIENNVGPFFAKLKIHEHLPQCHYVVSRVSKGNDNSIPTPSPGRIVKDCLIPTVKRTREQGWRNIY